MYVILVCAWLALAGQVAATSDDSAQIAQSVKDLVKVLDAPEKASRDDAEQKLVALGNAAIEHLPEVTQRTPAEVKLRLERIRGQLERSRAEASVQGSQVTLSVADAKLADVLALIEEQSGNKLIDYREQFNQEAPHKPLTLDLKNVSFWEACDTILDKAGLTIYGTPDEEGAQDALALVTRNESESSRLGRATYAGAFRLEPLEFSARRDLRNPTNHTLQLLLELAWEPRLRPIVVLQDANRQIATDDKGNSVAAGMATGELETPILPGTKSIEIPLQLSLPDRGASKLSSLKGKFTALLPGRIETYRFANIERAKQTEQRKAGVTVVVDELARNNELYEVRMRVIFEKASGALESHRNWIFDNEAYLEGPDGTKVVAAAVDTTFQDESEVGMAYLFPLDQGPKGYAFIYKTPATIVNVPVEFELKDLPLP